MKCDQAQLRTLSVHPPVCDHQQVRRVKRRPATCRPDMHVTEIVTGHYLKEGDQLQITLEAVDMENNLTKWRETLNVGAADMIAMRAEVTAKVRPGLVPALGAATDREDAGTRPRNEEAYDLHLRSGTRTSRSLTSCAMRGWRKRRHRNARPRCRSIGETINSGLAPWYSNSWGTGKSLFFGAYLAFCGEHEGGVRLLKSAIAKGILRDLRLAGRPIFSKARGTPTLTQLVSASRDCQNLFRAQIGSGSH